MKKLSLILLFILVITSSCYYIDSDSNMVDIIPPFIPSANITSNLNGNDTVNVTDSLLFKYKIELDTGKLFFADLYLESFRIFRSDTVADSVWIFPDLINNDTFNLTLLAYYKSYTGSLADLMDAEFYIADSSWTIAINRDTIQ